jgi:CDP-2,3-bis-(O-geranylgeranyl)-sn-glycerol synthase
MTSQWPAVRALLLLIAANLLPWALGRLCRGRWGAPLDLGFQLSGGRRLLGDHKTWRGLAVALVGTTLLATALRLSWWVGAAFGALSMLGDCLSSAWKRYRGFPPGRETFAIDQLPEALLPLLVLRETLGLSWLQLTTVTAVFALLDMLSMRVRHPQPRRSPAHE